MADKKIGAKIVLDGEDQFKQAINNSKAAMKQFESELKLTASEFKNNAKSMEALQKTQQTYSKQITNLQKQEKLYVEQLEKAKKAMADAEKTHEATAKSIQKLEEQLEEAKKTYGESSDEVKSLNDELKKSKDEYTKQDKAIANLENRMSKWNTQLNETQAELNDVYSNLDEVNHNIENYDEYIKEAGDATADANPEMKEFAMSVKELVAADIIAEGIKKLASAMVDMAKSAIDVGMQFEKSMSNVKALSGATADEYDRLADKAREMGATTMYSASEAADAMSYMALAGWDTEQMLEGIEPVLNLAAASNMELAQTSDIVTDYLTAFGLSAQDAGRFTDQLAYAMANSNTDVEMLGEAYKHCAAAAGSMGYSVEDVTGALMTMANAGVKGGEAGTSLRAIMINLATDTNGCASKLEQFGVQIYDNQGKMRNLSDILVDTSKAFEGLSDAESNSLAKTIAGKTQYTGFQTIMLGLSEAAKESGQSMTDYADALANCDGYAKQMADTMQDNLQGKLTILDSTLQALGESVYTVFDENLKEGVEGATSAVSRLNESVKQGDLNVSLTRLSKSLDKVIDKVIDWTEKNLPKIVDGLADIIDNADKLLPIIEGIATGLIIFKTASTAIELAAAAMRIYKTVTEAATVAQLAMNVAADANPYILLASVLAGVATAVGVWITTQKSASEEWREEAKEMVSSYNQISESVKNYSEGNAQYVENLKAQKEYVGDLVTELDALTSKENQSVTDKEKIRNIVEKLNTQFSDLNLELEEQNGKLVVSNENWKSLINTQLKQAQVSAIQERLTEAYQKQVDADLNLYEIQKKVNDIEEKHGDQLKELEQLYNSNSTANQTNIDRMYELEQELGPVVAEYSELKNSLEEAEDASQSAADGIDILTDYMSENETAAQGDASAIEEIGTKAEQTKGQLFVLTEEFQEQAGKLQESVAKTLESSNSIFEKTKEVQKQNIDEMKTNVQSHVDQIEGWKESYTELAGRVDTESGAILEYLANMGVEGKGYIDELLTLDDEQLNKFVKQMEEALTLPDEVASEVTESYTKAVQESIDGMRDVASDASAEGSELRTAEKAVADSLVEEAKKSWGEDSEIVREIADNAMTAVETAIEEATPVVQTDSQQLADAVKTTIENTVTYDAFYDIGVKAGEGLEQGLLSKVDDVRAAAQQLADAANSAVSGPSGFDEHSPSKKMERYGDLAGKGLQIGLENSMQGVVDSVNNMMPNDNNVEVSRFENISINSNDTGNGALARIDGLLTEYLPVLSQMKVVMDTGATVGALASPMNRALGRLSSRGRF